MLLPSYFTARFPEYIPDLLFRRAYVETVGGRESLVRVVKDGYLQKTTLVLGGVVPAFGAVGGGEQLEPWGY